LEPTSEPVDLADSDDWEDAAPPAPLPDAVSLAADGGEKGPATGPVKTPEHDEWVNVETVAASATPAPLSDPAKLPQPEGKDQWAALPDARLRQAEVAATSPPPTPVKPAASPEPTPKKAASLMHTPKRPAANSEKHIHSPFESKAVQSGATGEEMPVKLDSSKPEEKRSRGKRGSPPPPAVKKKLVLPAAPGHRKKATAEGKKPPAAAKNLPAPELPDSRSQSSGAHPRNSGADPVRTPGYLREAALVSPDPERGPTSGLIRPTAPSQPPVTQSPASGEQAGVLPQAENETVGDPRQPSDAVQDVTLLRDRQGMELVLADGGHSDFSGGGLVPVADSTITSPDHHLGWGGSGSRGYGGGEGQGGLAPIADSSVMHSSPGLPPPALTSRPEVAWYF
jgi:hypothetical protein